MNNHSTIFPMQPAAVLSGRIATDNRNSIRHYFDTLSDRRRRVQECF